MTQGRAKSVGIAAATTVLLHAGLAWWFWSLRIAPVARAPDALSVVWIDRVPPPPASPVPADTPAEETGSQAPAQEASLRGRLQATVVAPSPDVPVEVVSGPGAADLLEQAGAWARSQAQVPGENFARDPLRHRPAAAPDGRFAMRRGMSPEDVVRGIGQLLGGAGYTTDPCPQIRRNIANAGNGADPALAAEEIRRLRRFCL